MSDFKAKMHQIRFPVGLCPRTFTGREEEGGDRKGRGREGKGRRRGREGRLLFLSPN